MLLKEFLHRSYKVLSLPEAEETLQRWGPLAFFFKHMQPEL